MKFNFYLTQYENDSKTLTITINNYSCLLLQCWVSTGCELPMIDVMAAMRAALNLGSVVIAAVAALTVSANEAVSVPWEACKVESLVWWKKFGAKSGESRLSW